MLDINWVTQRLQGHKQNESLYEDVLLTEVIVIWKQ